MLDVALAANSFSSDPQTWRVWAQFELANRISFTVYVPVTEPRETQNGMLGLLCSY